MVPRRSNGHYSTTTTVFIWDVNASVPQVLDDGDFRYVYGPGRIAEVDGSDNAHYYLADGLGSTMALTDDSGTVENTYVYDPFDAIVGATGSQDNAFTFTGEQTDASTGLEYLRARYYHPQTGRFVSRDPLAAIPFWPEHAYAYAGSNPATYIDPVGLCTFGIGWLCSEFERILQSVGKQTVHDFHAGVNFLSRFATPSCAGFALDVVGDIAISTGGPVGILVAGAAFTGGIALAASEHDYVGLANGSASLTGMPLRLLDFKGSTALGAYEFEQRLGHLSLVTSFSLCALSATR